MTSPLDRRRAGVLLHPTSLPATSTGGVLGDSAHRFIDLLAETGFSVWQMLPVGPTDKSLSPYSSKSSFAGNVQLIDFAAAARQLDVDLPPDDVAGLLRAARQQCTAFADFVETQRSWLRPWACYALLRQRHAQKPWWQWPAAERDAQPATIAALEDEPAYNDVLALQFIFELQWQQLCTHAAARGVRLFGDLPFYTDLDSADVWAERRVFALDEHGAPREVAGVPPDYFSADGQLWGNPLYDWDGHREQVFDWWRRRLETQLARFDLLRLDHFRALESHWAVPAGAKTARGGAWHPTPGHELLTFLGKKLGGVPLVAEDLGEITPEVIELRDAFDLPGMLVLQFAFDGSADNPYVPEKHVPNAVVYTGTHDNDTTLGWYASQDAETRVRMHACSGGSAEDMPEPLIRTAFQSVAKLAVLPMQDLLGLGSEARMNVPGVADGNWSWQFRWEDIEPGFDRRWRALLAETGRL